MLSRLTLLLAVTLFSVGCHLSSASPAAQVAKSIGHVKINQKTGEKVAIPVGNKLTIVNVFDEFAIGCPTGNRFDTMERLDSLRTAGTTMLLIFSEKHFSTQDLENFKAIMPLAESLVQGDIEAIRPHLTYGKLLVVLDSKGTVIWLERPDTTEEQLFNDISRLIQSAGK